MDTAHILQDIPRHAAWPEETPPEGEAVRRPCGPEEDGVVRASHWRGHLEEAIEEEEEQTMGSNCARTIHRRHTLNRHTTTQTRPSRLR